jgi:hypothetical protein
VAKLIKQNGKFGRGLRNTVLCSRILDENRVVLRIHQGEIITCALVGIFGISILDALILRPGVYYIADSKEVLHSVAVHNILARFQADTFFRPLEYLVLSLANHIYLPLWLAVSLLSVVGAAILSGLASERLFDRQLPNSGWWILGIANPLLFYLVSTPGTVSQCLSNLLFSAAILAFISELRQLRHQPLPGWRGERAAVSLNLLAAALFFAKETAVAPAVLLPIGTALIRFKSQRLSSIFLFSLLFPLGAIIAWILIKMQLPMSMYLTSGARYSPKLNPISWAENLIITIAFPVTPLPSSFLGFGLLRPLWAGVALGSVSLFIALLLRESVRQPKIVLPLLVIAASCAPMILVHSNELYSSMIAPFAVSTVLLLGVKVPWSSLTYGLLLYAASLGNGIVYCLGPDYNLFGLERLQYSIYSKYHPQDVTCPIITTAHIGWDGTAFACIR